MKIAATLPDHGAIVEAVLDGFTVAACLIIATGAVPPFPNMLPIRYRKEQGETWLLPNQVVQLGEGDCEDLCIWASAGFRVTGQDPGARCVLANTGPRQIHCLVQMSDGQMYDPSRELQALENQRKRAVKAMSVSGFGIGDLVARDHRKPGARAPAGGPPPAAAPVGPTQQGTFGSKLEDDMKQRGVSSQRYADGEARLETVLKINRLKAFEEGRPGNLIAADAARRYAQEIGDQVKAISDIGKGRRSVAPPAAPVDPLALDPLSDPFGGAYMPFGPGYNPYYDPYAGGYAGGYGGLYGGDMYDNDSYVQQYVQSQYPYANEMPLTYEDIYGLESEGDYPAADYGDAIDVSADEIGEGGEL